MKDTYREKLQEVFADEKMIDSGERCFKQLLDDLEDAHVPGSYFMEVQEEMFSSLPEADTDKMSTDKGIRGRILSLYKEKVRMGGKDVYPAFPYSAEGCFTKGNTSCSKYEGLGICAFLKTLSPSEKFSILPKTAEESAEYIESPFVMDGRFDKTARMLTGDANVNNMMMWMISRIIKSKTKTINNPVPVLGDDNGVIGRFLEENGVNAISICRKDKGWKYGTCPAYNPVEELDYADAIKKYHETDFIILSTPCCDIPPFDEVSEAINTCNPYTSIIYIGPEVKDTCGLHEVVTADIIEADFLHVPFPGEDVSVHMFRV